MRRGRAPVIVHLVPTGFRADGVIGGAERYVLELARAMAREAPTRLVHFGPEAGGETEPGGLEVRRVPARWFFRGNRDNPLSLRFLAHLRDARVVHVHQFNTLVANLAHAAAAALGAGLFYTDLAGGGFNANVVAGLARRADGNLAISEFAARYMAERHGVAPARTRVIYGGVDPARYPFEAPDARPPRAVYLGRLVPHKGVEYLIRGLPPGWRAEVIGTPYDAGYAARLRDEAAGRPVEFLRGLGDDAVRERLRGAAALVLPTRDLGRRPELLGLVLIEAQALGTPVVATRVGALPEVVLDGETGLLVPPEDPAALGAALRRLEDPDLRRRLAAAARRRVEARFTWEACARACLEAYRELGP